jgi:hypothetical protein
MQFFEPEKLEDYLRNLGFYQELAFIYLQDSLKAKENTRRIKLLDAAVTYQKQEKTRNAFLDYHM